VHSRGGGAFPIEGGSVTSATRGSVAIRTDIDIDVPVLMLETETDEAGPLAYFPARQPDTDRIRLWDVAGGAHADTWLVPAAGVGVLGCKGRINEAPTHYVIEAALHGIDTWIRAGTPPPPAPRMDVRMVRGAPVIQRDALGIAKGGIRTAAVDGPVAVYSGTAASGGNFSCTLFGSTRPVSKATLAGRYPTRAAYVSAVTKATDEAIDHGWLLPVDRPEIIAAARRVEL
jgi:Alpha/beta hydrolase domain